MVEVLDLLQLLHVDLFLLQDLLLLQDHRQDQLQDLVMDEALVTEDTGGVEVEHHQIHIMYQCSGWPCMYIICGLLRIEVYVQVDSRIQSSIITLYLLFKCVVVKMCGISE